MEDLKSKVKPEERARAIQRVHLSPAIVAAVQAHALAAYPDECCGFLLGRRMGASALVDEARRAINRREDAPQRGYIISPADYLTTERGAEARGLDMLGFYHSHPDQSPAPSAADLRYAWPNTVYLVASVTRKSLRELGAFVLAADGSAMRALTITEGPHG